MPLAAGGARFADVEADVYKAIGLASISWARQTPHWRRSLSAGFLPLARPAMVFADLLNVERVEVLRGPPGNALRTQLGGRNHQHRHAAARQRVRVERAHDGWQLPSVPRRGRGERS